MPLNEKHLHFIFASISLAMAAMGIAGWVAFIAYLVFSRSSTLWADKSYKTFFIKYAGLLILFQIAYALLWYLLNKSNLINSFEIDGLSENRISLKSFLLQWMFVIPHYLNDVVSAYLLWCAVKQFRNNEIAIT